MALDHQDKHAKNRRPPVEDAVGMDRLYCSNGHVQCTDSAGIIDVWYYYSGSAAGK